METDSFSVGAYCEMGAEPATGLTRWLGGTSYVGNSGLVVKSKM